MKTKLLSLLFLTGLAAVITSCEVSDINNSVSASAQRSLVNGVCVADTFQIFAGQTIPAGELVVSNDGQNLMVQFNITAPNTLIETAHVWAGNDPLNVPQTKNGTPIPGQFPYKAENINVTSYTFTIPLADILIAAPDFCGQVVQIYAHAALVSAGEPGLEPGLNETAWSYGTPFPPTSTRWGWYSTYTICCGTVLPPNEGVTETAFVKFAKPDGRIFTTDKKSNPEGYASWSLTKNRWGWGLESSAIGVINADIYAGAGLNKIASGKKVGSAVISISNLVLVDVKLNLNPGVLVNEIHIYAGNVKPSTIAPGQYGFIEYFDPKAAGSLNYQFQLLSGLKFLIIHMVVQY